MPTDPAARNAPDRPPDRRIASRYHLKHAIGHGGMGVVWEAEDDLLKRPVAVKEIQLPPAGSATERFRLAERVLREARAAAQLGHHGAVTLYDVIEEEGTTFIVMELVAARTVAELVRDQGPLSPEAAADIGRQVLEALDAAHQRGIVHRDVKPGNVMVLPDGRSKLADFGIAKLGGDPDLTQTGMVMGSPSYIAPEQATGQRIGPATDLYGLGALLYFAVEGEPPFERGPVIATLNAVVHDEPRPMERAGPMAPVVGKLLRKDPDERPSADTLRWMLDQVAGATAPAGLAAGEPLRGLVELPGATPAGQADTQAIGPPPARPSAPPSPAPPRRHRPGRLAALLVAFAALVAVTLSLDLVLPDARGRQAAAPATTAPPAPSAPATTAPAGARGAQAAPAVPGGWTVYIDADRGYQIAHPPGWEVRRADAEQVDLVEEGSGRYLRIAWSDRPKEPLTAWRDYEPVFAAGRPGYERLRLEPTDFHGMDAAVWEYRYQDGGAELRAVNLTFVDDDGGVAYALNFQTHEPDWDRSQELFQQLKASFRPE